MGDRRHVDLKTSLDRNPRHDIMYTVESARRLSALLDLPPGPEAYVDVEVVAADLSERFHIRLWPGTFRPSGEHNNIWFMDEATCQRLESGTPQGPVWHCDGHFSTIDNPGGSAGKLNIDREPS